MDDDQSSPLSGDEEDKMRTTFDSLCRSLNMDEESKAEAWSSYLQINRTYTLEGKSLHWLACALYVACRKGHTTATAANTRLEGNGVSLTALLKAADFRLIEFFQKVKKWLDMAKCNDDLRRKIELLERNFSVSSCIYKKFEPIFYSLFHKPEEQSLRGNKGRKKKSNLTFLESLKSFCWTLYVRVKGNFPDISDDLVNSYHLLLCCLDLMFLNCITSAHRKEVLNPQFKDLPSDFMENDYSVDKPPCIVETLCHLHDGIVLESKQIREHHWKPFIKTLFETKVLKGNKDTLTGLFEPSAFENNIKHINQDYDTYVVLVGDFDERIFLGKNVSTEIGTPFKYSVTEDDIDRKERSHLRRNLEEHFNRANSLAPQTPLTGRGYLCEKDPSVSPISTATQSVSQLQNLLEGCGPYPSESLKTLFSDCKRNPTERTAKTVKEIGKAFVDAYTKPLLGSGNSGKLPVDFAKERLRLALSLFYKVLESILVSEKKRIGENADFSALLEQDVFVKCLVACCLELVVFAYNSQREFPWILDVVKLKPYYFYKVIEIVLREEDGLSRDVVKHLNYIEEKILEKLAWETGSPLYDALKNSSNGVPSCEDSTFPSAHPACLAHSIISAGTPVASPLITKQTSKQINGSTKKVTQPNSEESHASVAKRNLFGSPGNVGQLGHSSTSVPLMSPKKTGGFSPTKGSSFMGTINVQGQTLVFQQGKGPVTLIVPCRGSPNTTPINSPVKSVSLQGTPQKGGFVISSPSKAAKKTSSLGLFFRKVYHLASVRLSDLCTKLGVTEDVQKKIWTCFEYSLVNKIHLMLDRHLDQLLMCAVYVMSKVIKEDKKFHDIMRCYRTQPQAASHVYRQVLVSKGRRSISPEDNKTKDTTSDSSSDGTEPGVDSSRLKSLGDEPSNMKDERGDSEEEQRATTGNSDDVYGDLIEFYNIVYIKEIKDFALRFASNGKSTDAPPLSPLPVRRKHLQSPRKVSKSHEIYVSPIKPVAPSMTPGSRMLYCFDKSPSKNLKDINDMITSRVVATEGSRRRLSLTDDNAGPSPAKRVPEPNGITRKINELNKERLPNHI